MKHFQFAIASIVDANTGNGFAHGSNRWDYASHEQRAHEIRARSISTVLDQIGASLQSLIAEYRERSRQRRAIAELSRLSDHYLEDIGLARGDVIAAELGQVSLESLNAERRIRHTGDARALDGETRTRAVKTGASNQDHYAEARRA